MFLTLRETSPLRTLLIDPSPDRRAMFAHLLEDKDFAVDGQFADIAEALAAGLCPDLIILHAGDGGATEPVETLRAGTEAAVMVLVDQADRARIQALIAAGADQVVPLGVQSDRITMGAAAALGHRSRSADERAARATAEATLAEMRTLQRAKGILMTRQGLSEQDAHRRVQKMSMERNVTLTDMARQIIEAEDLLC